MNQTDAYKRTWLKSLYLKRHSIITTIILAALLVVLLLPFYWCMVLAFDATAITNLPEFSLLPHEFSLKSFQYASSIIDLPKYFLNTTIVTVINTVVSVFFALVTGYAFAKGRFAGKKFWFVMMLATMMIPFESRMIPLFLMYRSVGLIDTWVPLIVGSFAYVYGTFFARQNIASIPDSLMESARMDGAGEWKIFFKIVLPLCKPVASALAILQVVAQWNSYLWPMIVIRDTSKQLISVGVSMFNASQNQMYYGPRMAVILLSTIPIVILYLILQKHIVASVAFSGIKQ